MKAVLLAAGRGTRLAPITHSVPKILVPLAGRPLLAHQLRYLEENGVTAVAINVYHHADQVLRFLSTYSTRMSISISRETTLLGTAGALKPLADFLDEAFVVLYGDVVTDANLPALMAHHRGKRGVATIAYYDSPNTRDKGVCAFVDDDRLKAFVEKPDRSDGLASVSAGLYALDPAIIELVHEMPSDFGHNVWPRVIAAGMAAYGYRLGGYLRDIGSPGALEAANRDLAREAA